MMSNRKIEKIVFSKAINVDLNKNWQGDQKINQVRGVFYNVGVR
jgi:hypothetical protein